MAASSNSPGSYRSKGIQCFAFGCYNYANEHFRQQGISFHKFPDKNKQPDLYHQWVRNCWRDCNPSSYARLCSAHFEDSMVNKTMQRAELREGAVPTIFDLPDHLQPVKSRKRKTATSAKASQIPEPSIKQSGDGPDGDDVVTEYVSSDHSYNIVNDSEILKKRIVELERRNESLQKEVRNAKIREKRAKTNCKNLIEELKDKNFLTSELEMKPSSYGGKIMSRNLSCINLVFTE